jgi:hypothetical protein
MAKRGQALCGGWRTFFAALGVAVAIGVIPITSSTPAAADPAQQFSNGSCPVWNGLTGPPFTYAPITSGPLTGYCAETSGPLNFCPPGYTMSTFGMVPVCVLNGQLLAPGSKKSNFLKSLGLAPTWASWQATENATGTWQLIEQGSPEEIFQGSKLIPVGADTPPGAINNVIPNHLGMYVSPSGANAFDTPTAWGGGSVTHGSGYGVTDTAGFAPAGTTTPGFTNVAGNGGITGFYNASWLVPTNQSLTFRGAFGYERSNTSLGSVTGLPGSSPGSLLTDSFEFAGSFLYNVDATYFRGAAGVEVGHGSETQTFDGSTGNFNTRGYSIDAKLGHVFVLLNTTGSGRSGILTKAPPKPAAGYVVGLDASGHLGYNSFKVSTFTDSTGFVFGDDLTHSGDVGAGAKLFAWVPAYGVVWVPYVSGTLDRLFGFSSTLQIPDQVAFPGGDLISTAVAQTFWGTELGLDVRQANGWTVGVKGFYMASADTNIVGGAAYIKIPFDALPFAAKKY